MFGEGSIIDRKCENSRSGNKIENMLWAFKGGEPWPWRPEALPAGGKPSQSWEAKPELDLKNHFACRTKTKLNSLVVAPCCGGKNTVWDGTAIMAVAPWISQRMRLAVRYSLYLSYLSICQSEPTSPDLLLFVIPTRLTELLIPCGHPGHPAGIL